ncbi:MAG TPA: hypothetical protein DEP57_04150, partial [Selenomonas sp.]|nr:hypothetical protein [Selenomonas sp.]
ARLKLREAQWYWDWISAENGNGFHNPDKCMRASGLSIDLAHQVIEEVNAITKGAILPLPAQLPPPPPGTKAYINGQWTM